MLTFPATLTCDHSDCKKTLTVKATLRISDGELVIEDDRLQHEWGYAYHSDACPDHKHSRKIQL